MRIPILITVAAAAAAATLLCCWPATAAPPANGCDVAAPPPTSPTAAAVVAAAPASPPPAVRSDAPRLLRLPDGSEVAPLNGVIAPGPLVWGNVPYSPIVRTVRHRGVDWYEHQDGSRTTTLQVRRSDTGAPTPVTLVAHPQAHG